MDQPKERIEIESPLEVANLDEERYQQNAEEECHFNNLPNEIFENIFRYLNYKELLIASMVCRRWLEYIYHEKDLRKRHYCFASSISTTATYIKESPIKPFVALFFLCRTSNDEEFYATDNLFNLLPNCKIILLFTYIISLNEKLICRMGDSFPLVCALLPQISNVQINMVIVQENQLQENEEYKQMIETAVRQNHESMCLMLFCDSNNNFVWPMVKMAQSRFNNGKVTLCGGVVDQIRTRQEYCLTDCVALLITGRIRTWSVVLDMRERQSAEEKLQTFKQQVKLQKHTLGFVLFPREILSFSERKKELTTFKKLFPNVPLIGCSSLFEFEGDIYEKQCDKWCKQTSFTFMILTYD